MRIASLQASIAALATLGAGFMAYLTTLHFSSGSSAVCDFGAGFDCHIVNQSVYSEILGMPVSLLGSAYFAAVIVMAVVPRRRMKNRWRAIALFSAFSLAYSLYLSGIELFVLGTVCLFCELSKAVMAAILALSAVGAWKEKERIRPSWLAAAPAAGALFAVAANFLRK